MAMGSRGDSSRATPSGWAKDLDLVRETDSVRDWATVPEKGWEPAL
jgi:hypothetical protein